VQSPGLDALSDPTQWARLQAYVQGVVGAFAQDSRVLAWDVWNEPDNLNTSSYNDPTTKLASVLKLLPQVFNWARAAHPTQPLTSGVWTGTWLHLNSAIPAESIQSVQLESSDVISFHNYGDEADFEQHLLSLKKRHRPILCTEYMARPKGSTFARILPLAKKYQVALFNWGFVAGKTQTYLPWDSWQKPYPAGYPNPWFHDVFLPDGRPYDRKETEFIRRHLPPNTGAD
jgi:hypothetical protein